MTNYERPRFISHMQKRSQERIREQLQEPDLRKAIDTLAGRLPMLFTAEGVVYWLLTSPTGEAEDSMAWKLLNGQQAEVIAELESLSHIPTL